MHAKCKKKTLATAGAYPYDGCSAQLNRWIFLSDAGIFSTGFSPSNAVVDAAVLACGGIGPVDVELSLMLTLLLIRLMTTLLVSIAADDDGAARLLQTFVSSPTRLVVLLTGPWFDCSDWRTIYSDALHLVSKCRGMIHGVGYYVQIDFTTGFKKSVQLT